MELGPARLATVAKDLGIGDEFLFNDMLLYSSSFEKGSTDLEVAWSGIGQYKDLMTPMQTCMLTAAIANGGVMMEPRLLSRVADGNNRVTINSRSRVIRCAQRRRIRNKQNAMFGNRKYGTGRRPALTTIRWAARTEAPRYPQQERKDHSWSRAFCG